MCYRKNMITPNVVIREEKKIIGVEARTANAAETNPATAKIPALWQKFFHIVESIPHKTNSHSIFGAYTKYESDHRGAYSLLVAAEVSSFDEVPDGLHALILPGGKYMIFTAEGQMPQALIETWGQVWEYFTVEGEDERAYTTDYELHDPSNDARVEVYIAVK